MVQVLDTPRVIDPATNGFRLTLTTATAVTTGDVTGATTLYVTPYKSDHMAVYTGSRWVERESDEFSKALGTLTADTNYDVFVYDNAGTLTVDSFVAWTNDTTRATALVKQDGVWVKDGATTRRYVGTFRTTSTTATEDSAAKRFVWNADNRQPRKMEAPLETENSWTYTTATWRSANANDASRLQYVAGLNEEPVGAYVSALCAQSSIAQGAAGVGVDVTDANSADTFGSHIIGGGLHQIATYSGNPGLGFHFLQRLEFSQATGSTTWYGDGGFAHWQTGMVGQTWA